MVMKRTTFSFAVLCGLVLLIGAALTRAPGPVATGVPAALGQTVLAADVPFAVLPDGRGGTNVESVVYTEAMGFDKQRSLEAFKTTVYPLLRANCSGCHSTQNTSGSGAQALLHSDVDVNLAHEYALTRVNFREPANSRLVYRLSIERHNCFGGSCAAASESMLKAVTAWRDAVATMIPEVPRGVQASTKITEQQVLDWIEADRAKTPAAAREFIKYVSFHTLHNAGVSALNLNHARVGLSKALNTAARWAPRIANPVDVNGKGIVYRVDIRDYWGYTLIDTSAPDFELWYGGSDDDLAFAQNKLDLNGRKIAYASLAQMVHTLKPEVTRDDKFARLVWARILKGNAEGADEGETLPPNIDGFISAVLDDARQDRRRPPRVPDGDGPDQAGDESRHRQERLCRAGHLDHRMGT